MIKDMNLTGNIMIDIQLASGELFLNCNIPLKPTGDNERVISCWHEGRVKCFPLDRVLWFAFHQSDKEQLQKVEQCIASLPESVCDDTIAGIIYASVFNKEITQSEADKICAKYGIVSTTVFWNKTSA